jgi:hypothetical protein
MSAQKLLSFSYIKNLKLQAFVAHLCNHVFGQKELTRTELLRLADCYFDDGFKTGKYSLPYLYELLQVAFNAGMYECVKRWDFVLTTEFQGVYAKNYTTIENMAKLLPSHTVRDGDKVAYQQFSTPPHYAYVAAVAGQISPGEFVWEPSAGVAGLAAFAAGWVAPQQVSTNEIDLERWQLLSDVFGSELRHVHKFDAGQVHLLAPQERRPSVVLMNPPFSMDQGKRDPFTAARHIEAALHLLEYGGRLVAIVSGGIDWGQDEEATGMAPGAPRFRSWWKEIAEQYTVRCNIGIEGKVYRKFGTDFRTRLVVIDKVGPQGEAKTYTQWTDAADGFAPTPDALFVDAEFRHLVLDSREYADLNRVEEIERLMNQLDTTMAEPNADLYLRGGTEPLPAPVHAPIVELVPPDKQKLLGGLPAWRMARLLMAHGLHKHVVQPHHFVARLHKEGYLPLIIESTPKGFGNDHKVTFAHVFENGKGIESALHFALGAGRLVARSITGWGPLGNFQSSTKIGEFCNMMSKNILDQGFGEARLELVGLTPDGEFRTPESLAVNVTEAEAAIAHLFEHGTLPPEAPLPEPPAPTPAPAGGSLLSHPNVHIVRPGTPTITPEIAKALQTRGGIIPKAAPEVIAVVDLDDDSAEHYTTVEFDAEAGTSAAAEPEPVKVELPPVPARTPELKVQPEPEPEKGDVLDIFHGYKPFVEVPGTHPHNVTLVESNAMRMVRLPFATADVHLPQPAIEAGRISAAQAEQVVYAVHAHSQKLNDGLTRKGYMIGDGTGVGKGCEAASIGMHYYLKNQGQIKILWVSKEFGLLKDAKRDWGWVGGNESFVHSQDKMDQQQIGLASGVLFTTYSTLYRRGTPEIAGKKGADGKLIGYRAATVDRLQQLIDWKPDVILFDESHLMGNAVAVRGARGIVQPSARALAGIKLMKDLPDAAVTFLSATAATEVHNLGYAAERLGLCGKNVEGFPDLATFINEIEGAGMLGMELVARDMKALGVYNARSLSYEGTEFELLQHTLTDEQVTLYNEACYFWRMCYDWAKEGFSVTMANNQGKAEAMGQFWGAAQRFYNQILISIQTPTAIEDMLKHLRAGDAVVVQLVSTNEAATKRAVGEALANEQSLDDLDLTPKDGLLNFIKNCFPVIQYEEYEDDEGRTRTRVMKDGNGDVVLNPQAVKMQTELLIRVADMRVPKGALDQVLERMEREGFPFAEITGRSQRYLKLKDEVTGEFRTVYESRSKRKGDAEAAEFMADVRRGLIFSGAGNTGRSFQSDLRCQNQRRRYHYVLQAGWRADEAIQGLGRTHRTNQANAPFYKLVTTNLPGQKRFITSIARRIEQLGSLTKGNRKAASNSMFSDTDNLETEWAYQAISDIFRGLYNRVQDLRDRVGVGFETLCDMMGFDLIDKEEGGIAADKLPSVTQFLNRVLFLPVEMQFRVFTTFEGMHAVAVENARAKGLLDKGVERLTADRIVKLSEQLVYSDPKTGASTNIVELDCHFRNRTLGFEDALRRIYLTDSQAGYSMQYGDLVGFVHNQVSNRVYGLWRAPHRTEDNGMVQEIVRQTGPTSQQLAKTSAFDGENWKRISEDDARQLWETEQAEAPKFHAVREVLVTGALLPVWSKLRAGKSQHYEVRVLVAETEKGERIMGRALPSATVQTVLANLGVTSTGVYMSTRELLDGLLDGGTIQLSNGWHVARRRIYEGNYRVCVTGCNYKEAANAGLLSEFHGSQSYFVFHMPHKWEQRIAAFEKFTEFRQVVRLTDKNKVAQDVLNKEIEQSLAVAQQLEQVTSYSAEPLIHWHNTVVPLVLPDQGQELFSEAADQLAEAEPEMEQMEQVEQVVLPVPPALHFSNMVDCPHCGALAGSYCQRSKLKPGTPVVAHQARKALAEPKPAKAAPQPKPAPVPARVPHVADLPQRVEAPAPAHMDEHLSNAQRVQLLFAKQKRNSKTVKVEMAGQMSFF